MTRTLNRDWFGRLRFAASVVCGVVLPGCALVGPMYSANRLPTDEIPGHWTSPAPNDGRDREAASVVPAEMATLPWWTALSDTALDRLVAAAFQSSPTLDAARARLRQASLLLAETNASAEPSADGGATGQLTSAGDGDARLRSWLSLDASWEIDLFGAVRRGKEAAMARQGVEQASLADARVSLSADVTLAYLDFRECQSQVALSEQDIASRVATERLTAASVKEGFMPPYQAIRSTASVAEAKTQASATRARCNVLENLLTRLTGLARPALSRLLAEHPTGLDRLPSPRYFGIDVPAAVLLRRPDLRAAERRLAAACADIGLAEAERYPRLTLSGTLGYSVSATPGSHRLTLGSWSVGPSLSLPIFDAGRRVIAVEIAQARYDEAAAAFKAAARVAIQDVENALTRYAAAYERTESAETSARLYKRYFDVIEMRYREGASNLLELEDARRAMLTAERTLLGVRLERLQAWVALHRSTGGAAEYPGPVDSNA